MTYNDICKKLFNDYWEGNFYNYNDRYRILDNENGKYSIISDNYEVGYLTTMCNSITDENELCLMLYDDNMLPVFKKKLAYFANNYYECVVYFVSNPHDLFSTTIAFETQCLDKLITYSKLSINDKNVCLIWFEDGTYSITYVQNIAYNIKELVNLYLENIDLEILDNVKTYWLFNNDYQQFDCYYFVPSPTHISREYARLYIPKEKRTKIANINDVAKNYINYLKCKEFYLKRRLK